MARGSQDGLEWENTLFNLIPRWTREPSVEAIQGVCRQQLNVPAGGPCTASFYAAGAFNKLYLIACAEEPFLMRVTLPVSPHYKTRGEVATLRWVREHTNIPVPKVIAFEDNNDNIIGFEWILMELMPGTTAYRRWRTMSLEQKSAIAKSVAEFQVQLSCYGAPSSPFRSIGTLNLLREPPRIEAETRATPGMMISHEFFMGDRIKYDIPRGPFNSSHDWLNSEIRLIILEQTAALENAEDEDDREDAEETLDAARKLRSVLPKVFPEDQEEVATALYHEDLSLHNILVDKEGKITAIVDWECVSAMPIWLTTKMPKFLVGENREEEPIRDMYADEIPGDPQNDSGPDNLDNEGKDDLYWIHLMDYETTQLRAVYERRLRELWPAWPLRDSQIKVDFFDAVLECNAGIFLGRVGRWADSIERGDLVKWADVE
ncbi:hypothetical protein KVR01_011848 [Diaporthe batatas]|uniref:uncharacterized protein n=1 Tax=Diaporthe batatas TaxID=748121 RepID=UPI001D0457B9|nr:uncharacterized protein KVR01_011848 [Diaporthe batatas]KAG8158087.1 hypothetical protein KVR01_011848 [Diaporthe batatas]